MNEIYFQIEGKDYAYRVWPSVPRIGDKVMMHPMSGAQTHRVLDVCWGVREDETRDRVTCNVLLAAAVYVKTTNDTKED